MVLLYYTRFFVVSAAACALSLYLYFSLIREPSSSYFAVSFFLLMIERLRMVLVRAEVMSAGAKTGPPGVQWRGHFFAYLGTCRTWVQRTQVRQVRQKIAYLRTTSSHGLWCEVWVFFCFFFTRIGNGLCLCGCHR